MRKTALLFTPDCRLLRRPIIPAAALFLIIAIAGPAHTGLLQETLFSKVAANHSALSFAREENSDFQYPTRFLGITDPVLTIPYTYEDLIRVRENGVLTDVLRRQDLGYRYSMPLSLPLRGSAAGIAYEKSDLSGKIPSLSFTGVNSEQEVYSGALATSLGRYSLGLSGQRGNSVSAGDIKIEKYPRSDDALENAYFYDLLEKYFGKDMRLSDQGERHSYTVEGKAELNSGSAFGLRATRSRSLDKFSLRYFSQDKMSFQSVDSPLDVVSNAYDAYFQLKVKEWWDIKLLSGRETAKMRFDMIPRGADPATEITHFGNISLDGRGAGCGIATSFRIKDRTKVFGGVYYSKMKNNVRAYFSTPVLGQLYFLPIVHRAKFDGDFSTPSRQWQLGMVRKFSRRFEASSVINYQIMDIPLRISGETNLGAGLVNSSYYKKIVLRGVKFIYGYAGAGYQLSKNMKLDYRADLSVPILPKNFKKTLGLSKAEETQPAPSPAAPQTEHVDKNTFGGINHQITLQYVF